jgi:hypothetical protein
MGQRGGVAIVLAALFYASIAVAHASPVPLQVRTLLSFSQLVDLVESVLVDGFGEPAPGEPLGPPWAVCEGAIAWVSEDGVGKPGGQSPGDNIAVVDAGASSGIVVQTTIEGLVDGPAGGNRARVGLAVLADADCLGQQVLVAYERATGRLSVSTSDEVLATSTVAIGLNVLDPLRVELRSVPGGASLDVSLNGGDVLTVTVPEPFATYTSHGIYVSRDNSAVFTQFTIEVLP